MAESRLTDELYRKLVNEEDARVCRDISDDACHETPGNFLKLLQAQFLTKLGDAIASPKTVLAWLTTTVGAPPAILGFLVPVRESGSMIPQLLIAGLVRRQPVRKWVWVAGSFAQGLAVGGLAVVALTMTGTAAGFAILGLVVVFSLARGFCSVASKDVLGKTIPKTRRGRLTGWSASAAGLATMGVGASLSLPFAGNGDTRIFAVLLAGAAALWVVAALVYARVNELPGETGGGANAIAAAFARLSILRTDFAFRRFVIARALLMCSALSAPFYVAVAQERGAAGAATLGMFVAASGLASLVSAPVWGRFADRSSKRVMVAAAVITSGIGLVVFAADRFYPEWLARVWVMPGAFFVLSLAHAGVRVGRKTYVVDLADGNRRTDYVSVSNTVIGVLLLAAGSIGALAPLISNAGVVGVLSLMGLAGAVMSASLPEVQS